MSKLLKILLIEDNPADADLLQEMLVSRQVKIKRTSSLAEGLTLGHAQQFDVVLLDLMLPDSEGVDTITRASKELANYPIIVLTGMEDEEIAEKAISRGAQDYIVKGQIDERSLLRAIRYAIDRKQVENALELAKQELEKRVEERTADLSRAIDSLHTEVEGRILAEEALRNRSNQLRELASELTLTEQRERRRTAKVLHDNLQQLLVGARFQLSTLQRHQDRSVQSAAQIIDELLMQSIDISRTLTSELSPPILYEGGLVPALKWLARWMHETHGLDVQLTMNRTQGGTEPDDIKVLLFETVRELLLNVVKHARVKSAEVRLEKRSDLLKITVKDQGSGFDPAEVTRRGPSGGFGLFGIRERLDFFGGSFLINSSPGKGSRFVAMVPTRDTMAVPPAANVSHPLMETGPEVPAAEELKIRVLLADDHAVVRQGLTQLLDNEPDIQVIAEASDGEQALNLARHLRPEVLLMDINMPNMNGIEATRLIHSEMPQIKVIGLSMFEGADRAEEMKKAGAVAYVSKSGDASELISVIRDAAVRTFQTDPRKAP
jgi:DNA-binding NarL/FixJ family response regulator